MAVEATMESVGREFERKAAEEGRDGSAGSGSVCRYSLFEMLTWVHFSCIIIYVEFFVGYLF